MIRLMTNEDEYENVLVGSMHGLQRVLFIRVFVIIVTILTILIKG